jgi:hypothetical protein
MLNLLLLIVYSTTFSQKDSADFSVAIELLQSPTAEGIKLEVLVKNLSGYPTMVLQRRREDYKREKIRALGNYVIEVQKWESDSYQLFTPSADIDPVYLKEEFVKLQSGDAVTDTLNISGRDFSRAAAPKSGFPSGKYRIKIYFNQDMWATSERNGSSWIEFTIE